MEHTTVMGGDGAARRVGRNDEVALTTGPAGRWCGFPDWAAGPLFPGLAEAILDDCWHAPDVTHVADGPLAHIDRADVQRRLIVYGSLAPGEENADQLADLAGHWCEVRVPGRIDRSGRYPLFYPGAELQPALLFDAPDLPSRYPDLDRFEGLAYKRIWWPFLSGSKWSIANIYAARSRI